MQASGASEETSFSVDLTPEQLQAERPMKLLYWKGYYPRADVEGFITWGNANQEKFAEGVRDKLFSMTLKPTKVQRWIVKATLIWFENAPKASEKENGVAIG